MTTDNKRIFIEIADNDQLEDFVKILSDKKNKVIMYTKGSLKITDVDMDNAVVRDITGNVIKLDSDKKILVPDIYEEEKKIYPWEVEQEH